MIAQLILTAVVIGIAIWLALHVGLLGLLILLLIVLIWQKKA